MRLPAGFFAFPIAFVLLSACGEEEEAPSQEPSATPEASPTAEATSSPTSAVPTPTLPPIPADWPTYADPDGRFTARYPLSWHPIEGSFFSYDARIPTSPPPERIKVEVSLDPVAGLTGYGGAIAIDPETGEASIEDGATATSLNGHSAWQMVRLPGSGIQGGYSRIQGVSLIYQDTCVLVTAYFTQQDPDVPAFLQIASTFVLTY